MSETRCRFAPAPTGHLHIGGARTALFNWLFARSTGGKFILRIEDTDIKRSDTEATEGILRSLKWLGMDWDEGPVFQSKRQDRYKEAAEKLLASGAAFEEKTEKGTAVRFTMPREDVSFHDVVHGAITFPAEKMEDLVIMKSDGTPTYNFACVVDDHEMEITHVIRGDDHITNTPKQVVIYKTLGWKPPLFAHVPMIHGEDGSKLSKRHGASSAMEFRGEGYLPQALINFIALLGWSPGDDREVMALEALISSFGLDRIKKTSAIFDRDKLDWMNAQYIKTAPASEVVDPLLELLRDDGVDVSGLEREWLEKLIDIYRERMKRLTDFVERSRFFFGDISYDEEAVDNVLRKEGVAELLSEAAGRLESLSAWTVESVEEALRGMCADKGVKLGALGQPVRVAVTGTKVSPGLFETLALLGKDRTVARLRAAAGII